MRRSLVVPSRGEVLRKISKPAARNGVKNLLYFASSGYYARILVEVTATSP